MSKTPATDKSKSSKEGKLKLHPTGNGFITISSAKETSAQYNGYVDSLSTILKNGVFTPITFDTILKNSLM